MPDEETQVDELDELEELDQSKEKSPARNWLVIGLVACVGSLLLALGLAAGYIVGQVNQPQVMVGADGQVYLAAGDQVDKEAEAEAAAEAEAEAEAEATAEAEAEAVAKAEEELGEAIYLSLRPEFTVNFFDGKKERYLMASIDLMARNQEIIDLIEKDKPVVRYQILRVLGRQDATLFEEGGKDQMLGQILEAVQGVIDSPAGEVEAVYLTSFVVQ